MESFVFRVTTTNVFVIMAYELYSVELLDTEMYVLVTMLLTT